MMLAMVIIDNIEHVAWARFCSKDYRCVSICLSCRQLSSDNSFLTGLPVFTPAAQPSIPHRLSRKNLENMSQIMSLFKGFRCLPVLL